MNPLKLGMVGGGQGAFIGGVHRFAARLDGKWELVAGALSSDLERAASSAADLGIAMQLTNILRDVGEDAQRGRCYLPAEDMARFGLTPQDVLTRGPELARDAGWAPLMVPSLSRTSAN